MITSAKIQLFFDMRKFFKPFCAISNAKTSGFLQIQSFQSFFEHGLNGLFDTRLFIRFIRKIRVRFKKVLYVLSVLFRLHIRIIRYIRGRLIFLNTD